MAKSVFRFALIATFLAFSLSVGSAEEGETHHVKHRIAAMNEISFAMKKLGAMFRGGVSYSPDVVKARAQDIFDRSGDALITQFLAGQENPNSRAKAELWLNFEDFKERSLTLQSTADQLISAVYLHSEASIHFERLVSQCKGCHEIYRLPK